MAEVAMLLCFDERILKGAGVTILSAVNSAAADTLYDFQIFHPGLSDSAIRGLRSLVEAGRHRITFYQISSDRFAGAPTTRGSWTEIVYYRLLASEILTNFKKVIYSDVDVFVTQDLSEVFNTDLENYEWAGVAAEKNAPNTRMHRYFPENNKDQIFFSGFMVMNLELMRAKRSVERYVETINLFRNRLKFFDLDVLNLATGNILPLPFKYVTLEDIFEADDITTSADYSYLKTVYSLTELEQARDDPAIIHFAGCRGKPWQRQQVPIYYEETVNRLPRSLMRWRFRDFRKKWLSRKGHRRYPVRQKKAK